MPTPRADESRDDFIDRCMGDAEAVADYPDADQRLAVCNSLWGDKSMQTKSFAFEVKKEPDEDGIFEGYASTFGNVDQGMDIVERGAFANSIANRKPKMLWQHDMREVIGVWDDMREDERGLFVKGRLLKDVSKGREAMALMHAGAIDSMSIGYKVKEAEAEGGGRIRRLKEVELFEVSLVTFAMNESAMVTDVKSIETERQFEAFLRDAGYSRKEAKAITAGGFKAITGQRDAVADGAQNEGYSALMEQIRQLQEKTQCLSKNST